MEGDSFCIDIHNEFLNLFGNSTDEFLNLDLLYSRSQIQL